MQYVSSYWIIFRIPPLKAVLSESTREIETEGKTVRFGTTYFQYKVPNRVFTGTLYFPRGILGAVQRGATAPSRYFSFQIPFKPLIPCYSFAPHQKLFPWPEISHPPTLFFLRWTTYIATFLIWSVARSISLMFYTIFHRWWRQIQL